MREANPSALIIAAEASSALYAQRLLEHWKSSGLTVDAFGVGSREMEKLGFEVLGRAEDLAVMGLVEVLRHYFRIRKVFYKIVDETKKRRPQIILLLDYPGFNLRLAEKLKPLGIPIVYYISPQVWAWKKLRIEKIKKIVDKMLVLLPFEKKFYKEHGVNVDFVGHPLLDELEPVYFDKKYQNQLKSRFGVSPNDTLIGLMPGSRRSELVYNLPSQMAAAEILYQRFPHLKFALLVAPSFERSSVAKLLPRYSFPLIIVQDEPMKMVCMTDYLICKSGTTTLLVGLLLKPMVIMYRMNWFTAWIAKKIVTGIQFFGLVNLIADKKIVSELYQDEANGENLAKEVIRLIEDQTYRNEELNHLAQLAPMLGNKGATARVSKIIEPILKTV